MEVNCGMSEAEESKGEAEGKGAGEGETGKEEGGAGEPITDELRPLDVYMALQAAITQMSAVAWQMMGLQPDPFTGKVYKDAEQARIAIDTTAFLVEKMLPRLQGQEARDYQSLLTDLRLNFVRQASGEK